MVAVSTTGPHFKDPWVMNNCTVVAASLKCYDKSNTLLTSDTTAFFTGFAQWGLVDSTDWVANTFKTIYSHTGKGLITSMVACTAGGAETTTFEITIDGVLSTVTVTNASGERAALLVQAPIQSGGTEFTTAAVAFEGVPGQFDAGLTTFQTGITLVPSYRSASLVGAAQLRYDISCLIRMKHSASITNSTATSYSGVQVRKGLSA